MVYEAICANRPLNPSSFHIHTEFNVYVCNQGEAFHGAMQGPSILPPDPSLDDLHSVLFILQLGEEKVHFYEPSMQMENMTSTHIP